MASYRQGRFPGFPPVIKWLIIINFGVWILELLWHGPWFLNYFSLFDMRSPYFKPHQFISYMFMHEADYQVNSSFYLHILLNMFALWMFGNLLEQRWGSKRFLNFYLITGIGAGILYGIYLYFVNTPYINAINEYQLHPSAQLLNEINSRFFNGGLNASDQVDPAQAYNFLKASGPMAEPILGASGAIFGILVAFAMTFPNMEMFIIPIPFPVKAKYVVLGYIAIEIWSGVSPRPGDNVAHWAHLGGALVGFITLKLMNKFDRTHFY